MYTKRELKTFDGEPPMPGFNVPDDYFHISDEEWEESYGNKKKPFKRLKRRKVKPRKRYKPKRYSLRLKKGRKRWNMIKKFKSLKSRARAKRALSFLGWR